MPCGSLLNSPERLGGGGDGGLGVPVRGLRGALSDGEGVCPRPGIRNPLEVVLEITGLAAASGFKKGD